MLSVSAAALLMSFVLAIMPEGRIRHTAKFLGALLVVLVVVSPVVKLNAENMARTIAKFEMEKESLRTGIEVKNREILSELIKENTQAYILDKAERMGIAVTVDVTMRDEGDYPFPVSVMLTGRLTPAEQTRLERVIEQDLGIPPECQEWRNDG